MNAAKTQIGERIMKALEQLANDPTLSPKNRREAARKLAIWKEAAAK